MQSMNSEYGLYLAVCHVTCNVSNTSTSVETDALLVLVLLLTTGEKDV